MALVNVQFQIDDEQLIAGPQGPQGEPGLQGEQGLQGPQGPAGPAGSGGSSEIVDIMDFGGSLSGDNTAALNAALAHCIANQKTKIGFQKGFYRFNSAPNAIDGITLIGQGKTATYLVRDYSGNFLNFGGGFTGGGGAKDMGILAGAGTSGGYGLHLKGQDGVGSADWCTLEHLYISSNGGTFAVPIMIDGAGRTTPQGVRSVRIVNCDVFAGTAAAIWVANGVATFMDSVGTYPAGGTNGNVVIGTGSTIVSMSNMNIQGTLNLSDCLKITFQGHTISFIAASSASGVFCNGTRSNSGTYSNGMAGGTFVINMVPT